MPVVAGIGYEGRSAEELVSTAKRAGITILVDIRLNPISRKPGLSKTRLSSRLGEAGIGYIHMAELGNPKDNREGFRDGDSVARGRYRMILANGASSFVDDLVEMVSEESVALLCFERDSAECHRSAVADEMIRREPSISVIDI